MPMSDKSLRIISDHSRSCHLHDCRWHSSLQRGPRARCCAACCAAPSRRRTRWASKARSSTRYVDEIVKLMGDVYPEIVDNRELIRRVILS